MLTTLIRQELRRLWPWIAVWAVTELSLQLFELLSAAPDARAWVSGSRLFNPTLEHSAGMPTLALALLFCQTGFPRDEEDGTQAFLFSLPVPRAHIFLARVLAPGLVLSLEVLFWELLRWLAQLPSTGTFSAHTFRMDWLLATLLTSLGLSWISVGYAQLLTVFRRFGLLIVFTFYLALSQLGHDVPWLRKLDPLTVLHVEFVGQRALLPGRALLGHALGALFASCLAAWFWVGPTELVSEPFARWRRRAPLRWLLRPFVLWSCAVLLAGWAGVSALWSHYSQRGPHASKEEWPLKKRTRYHEFTYPPALAPRIELLAAVADELHERLAARLGLAAAGPMVTVDFTRSSDSHAGAANRDTIRMAASASPTAEELERVFAHEDTHVLAQRASDQRLSSEADAVGFFSEGLAEALALELRPSAAVARARQLEAALAHQRLSSSFDRMIHYEDFRQRYGTMLVYSTGLTWTQALIASCGQQAPQKILMALGSPDVPLKQSPLGLWQHLLQRADCDLSRVNAAWQAQLAASSTELAAELERVPLLEGGNARWDGDSVRLLAQAEREPVEGTVFSVNVRTQTTGPELSGKPVLGTRRADGALEFRVPASAVLDGALQFQLRLHFERQGVTVSFANEWTKTRVAP